MVHAETVAWAMRANLVCPTGASGASTYVVVLLPLSILLHAQLGNKKGHIPEKARYPHRKTMSIQMPGLICPSSAKHVHVKKGTKHSRVFTVYLEVGTRPHENIASAVNVSQSRHALIITLHGGIICKTRGFAQTHWALRCVTALSVAVMGRCGTVRGSSGQFGVIRCGSARFGAVRRGSVRRRSTLLGAVCCGLVRHGATRCGSALLGAAR